MRLILQTHRHYGQGQILDVFAEKLKAMPPEDMQHPVVMNTNLMRIQVLWQDRQLMDVITGAVKYSCITFMQLGACTTHVHVATTKHPVSRVITTRGVLNPNHARKIIKKAKSYVDHMDDLARKKKNKSVGHMLELAVFLLKGHFLTQI